MEKMMTVEAQNQCFPVPGRHQPLPRCFSASDIFHFPNVVDLKGTSSCLAILACVRVQSSDKFRSREREDERVGRGVNFGIMGCCWFEVFGPEHSDGSRLLLFLYG